MAPHSSTIARKIPWTEEPGRLQSMGSLRVRHDWVTSLSLSTFMHWRRKWQPTPVFLPGESHGRRSLVGCSPLGRTESDTTEATWRQWPRKHFYETDLGTATLYQRGQKAMCWLPDDHCFKTSPTSGYSYLETKWKFEFRYLFQGIDVCAWWLSHVWLFATPWTVACQAPLSIGFSRREYWSGLPFPSTGVLLDPGIEPTSPALIGRHILTTVPPGKPSGERQQSFKSCLGRTLSLCVFGWGGNFYRKGQNLEEEGSGSSSDYKESPRMAVHTLCLMQGWVHPEGEQGISRGHFSTHGFAKSCAQRHPGILFFCVCSQVSPSKTSPVFPVVKFGSLHSLDSLSLTLNKYVNFSSVKLVKVILENTAFCLGIETEYKSQNITQDDV